MKQSLTDREGSASGIHRDVLEAAKALAQRSGELGIGIRKAETRLGEYRKKWGIPPTRKTLSI